MPRIFISYRREDTSGYAGRLFDRLEDRFGKANVFMDIDSLAPGVDLVEVINSNVGACDVLLAIIGRNWLSATDDEGRRRLENPEDFVRLEISAALKRGIRVIPLLVGGAQMPGSQKLPQELAGLARLHAALIFSDSSFRRDIDLLINTLENVVVGEHRDRGVQESQPRKPEHQQTGATSHQAPEEFEDRTGKHVPVGVLAKRLYSFVLRAAMIARASRRRKSNRLCLSTHGQRRDLLLEADGLPYLSFTRGPRDTL